MPQLAVLEYPAFSPLFYIIYQCRLLNYFSAHSVALAGKLDFVILLKYDWEKKMAHQKSSAHSQRLRAGGALAHNKNIPSGKRQEKPYVEGFKKEFNVAIVSLEHSGVSFSKNGIPSAVYLLSQSL